MRACSCSPVPSRLEAGWARHPGQPTTVAPMEWDLQSCLVVPPGSEGGRNLLLGVIPTQTEGCAHGSALRAVHFVRAGSARANACLTCSRAVFPSEVGVVACRIECDRVSRLGVRTPSAGWGLCPASALGPTRRPPPLVGMAPIDEHVVPIVGGREEREWPGFADFARTAALAAVEPEPQRGIPAPLAIPSHTTAVEAVLTFVPSTHRLICGDARKLDDLPDASVHLVVTSPPYWTRGRRRPSIRRGVFSSKDHQTGVGAWRLIAAVSLAMLEIAGVPLVTYRPALLERIRHDRDKLALRRDEGSTYGGLSERRPGASSGD